MEHEPPNFVLSDDILSPEEETRGLNAITQSDSNQMLGSLSATISHVASIRSMDTIFLDAQIDESIDLGNESIVMEQSLDTAELSSCLAEKNISEKNSCLPPSDLNSATASDVSLDATRFPDPHSFAKQVQFTDKINTLAPESVDVGEPNKCVSLESEIHELPLTDISAEAKVISASFSKHITVTTDTGVIDKLADDGSQLVAGELVSIGFVEDTGLNTAVSSRSLSKFFIDSDVNGGGTDAEGRSFFDSFTAGESDILVKGSVGSSPQIIEHLHSVSVNDSSSTLVISPTRQISETSVPAFQFQSGFQNDEGNGFTAADSDPFSSGIFSNDYSRQNDAWIPSGVTRQILMSVIANGTSNNVMPAHQTTRPCVIVEESLGDPVRDTVEKFLGEQEAAKRLVLNADSVPQNEIGLLQLIKADSLRAAVDLTCRLLAQCGQGPNSRGHPMRHTPFSLQLWYCRLALLVKLHLYSSAEAEMDQFGDLDTPDLYHEYYMQQSGLTRLQGSMVPFDFRLLHAELPQYLGKNHETLDRLHRLLSVIRQILLNLSNGLAEDGSMLELNNENKQVSLNFWGDREVRVLYALGNSLLNLKDYIAAMEIFNKLLDKDNLRKSSLYSGIGRIYLQLGDAKLASKYFERANSAPDANETHALLHRGLLQLCSDNFKEAYGLFKNVVHLEPSNVVAINNLAVCSLYLGRLKEALRLLEDLVYSDPSHHLQEAILLNLCTLYELESSRALVKKQSLLSLVSQYRGNGFNVSCLKLS